MAWKKSNSNRSGRQSADRQAIIGLSSEVRQAIQACGINTVPEEVRPMPGGMKIVPERVTIRLPHLAKTGYGHLASNTLFTRVFAVCQQNHDGRTVVRELAQSSGYEKGSGRSYQIEEASVADQLDNLVFNASLKPIRLVIFSKTVTVDGWLANRWYAAEPPAESRAKRRPANGAGCRRKQRTAA